MGGLFVCLGGLGAGKITLGFFIISTLLVKERQADCAWASKHSRQFCKAAEINIYFLLTQAITVSHVTGNKDYREQSLMDCDYCSGTD